MNDIPVFIVGDLGEYYGGNKLEGESKQQLAEIYGGGVSSILVLNIPNTKNINDLQKVPYFEKFKEFQGERVSDDLVFELEMLKEEIENYCYGVGFYTYESRFALELEVYDYR